MPRTDNHADNETGIEFARATCALTTSLYKPMKLQLSNNNAQIAHQVQSITTMMN